MNANDVGGLQSLVISACTMKSFGLATANFLSIRSTAAGISMHESQTLPELHDHWF